MSRSSLDIIAVVRTAHERTADAAVALAAAQLPAGAVEVVCEKPFEKALKKTFEIGIRRNARWTMTLDGDVLLRPGAIEKFIAQAEAMPDNFVQIEGRIHDKLTGMYRQAGHRIYRTSLLPLVLQQVPAPGEQMRPEYSTLQKMEKLGHPSRRVGLVVGIHDYEQYLRDVYRKSHVHATKHAMWLQEFVERWKKLGVTDDDFRVALRGLYDGLISLDKVRIDIDAHGDSAGDAVRQLGLTEKSPLPAGGITAEQVEAILRNAGEPPPLIGDTMPQEIPSASDRFKSRLAKIGPVRMLPLLLGAGFVRVGNSLKRIAQAGLPKDSSR